eukprot:CAMPEP_0116909820 /NCGR_PEP_ID=MMETSP0467-20121206/14510_1 /TAXON_ID=283647 /ORGANISM="Mesodinium pulex, Strain SPMC105" /LENGTH=38 /DNA_ID= /DNA_START= /DNA_END= /DNA_ORIENTATION=
MPLVLNWNNFKNEDLADRENEDEFTEFERMSINKYIES